MSLVAFYDNGLLPDCRGRSERRADLVRIHSRGRVEDGHRELRATIDREG